ncbi:Uncharacterized protein ALO80_03384 [Pseudomonas caricapapayae]|uniref:Uncharacterized protein n=1 Tax=Pseudomonas caricapapayae TaxID=46678 RepID=A0A0P9KHR6_9PSED|nr:DUF6508 domain-containing protein [Pseudomonas caricapapayae]KAA8695894.1 hypothetical protein F4W67_09820 [Pseudomonas caricapapayae]KPW55133.1 Uncharacterized protein ALO80_03384 [Pseudomonas caricapapayae]RMM13391.1 hypothetical protein ALQ84_00644 [Pseudomonas caricapapayae]RMV94729.1 hypothetical protein ALP01_02730 [Pseudomonas caricapapayae]
MIKLLMRLKTRLDRKPKAHLPDRLSPAQPVDQQESMSRVQANLAWLPVCQELQPLRLQPPACPPVGQQNEPLRARYHAYVAHMEQADPDAQDQSCRETGRQLAGELQSAAIDTVTSKAENSPQVYWLTQSAAIASLFAEGAQSEAFQRYRDDVWHYKEQPLTAGQVWAFDRYVAEHTPRQVRTFLPHPSDATRLPDEPAPGPEDIDQLLSYLPLLYPDGVAIKTYTVRANTYWPDYFPVVEAFYRAVANECWCDIDYLNHGAADMLEDDTYIAQANLADMQTLLTYCIRGERFCDGHHGSMIEKDYVLKILRRLAVLRED